MSDFAARQPLNPCEPEIVKALLPPSGRLLDIGCGSGALLTHLAQSHSYTLTGVEPNGNRAAEARAACGDAHIVEALAEALPFDQGRFDMAVMECVFSLCEPQKTIEELYRVLTSRGILIITDVYARAQSAVLSHAPMLRALYTREMLENYFLSAFSFCGFSDYSHALTEWFMQMTLDGHVCDCAASADIDALRAASPGYGVWKWMKR